MDYSEEDKDIFRKVLRDDIENVLEEYESTTGRKVLGVTFTRVDMTGPGKTFEYIAKIRDEAGILE